MKLFLLVLIGALALANAETECRSNCQATTTYQNDDGDNCFCDDQCEAKNDCCPSYFTYCETSATDVCRGNCDETGKTFTENGKSCFCDSLCTEKGDCCDSHAAECGTASTSYCKDNGCDAGEVRDGSCYCDDQCTEKGDCCDDYTSNCAGTVAGAGGLDYFCESLDVSKSVFCDGVPKKSSWFKMETKITAQGTRDAVEWAQDTYKETCITSPEPLEATSGRETYEARDSCFEVDDVSYRYACVGLNTIYTQKCDNDNCRASGCEDNAWQRTYHGLSRVIKQCIAPFANHTDGNYTDAYPQKNCGIEYVHGGAAVERVGACHMDFVSEYVDGKTCLEARERATAWSTVCSDEAYSGNFKFFEWKDPELTEIFDDEDASSADEDSTNQGYRAFAPVNGYAPGTPEDIISQIDAGTSFRWSSWANAFSNDYMFNDTQPLCS